jgi:hypothetical protein
MSAEPLARFTKLSKRSKYLLNRFQKFFLFAWLINIAEAIGVVTTVLITRPKVTSPFFFVPITILGATVVTFIVLGIVFAAPFFRSVLADVRHRKQNGLD